MATVAVPNPHRNDRTPEPMSERVVVRCFSNYRDAKRAVDRLRVASIPERRITVMGCGLRWRNAFTAERSVGVGGGVGAIVAGATALLLWSLGGLDQEFSWLGAVVSGAFLGGAIGVVVGLAGWWSTRRSRGIPETGHVDVERYDVLVELDAAEQARELLDRGGDRQAA